MKVLIMCITILIATLCVFDCNTCYFRHRGEYDYRYNTFRLDSGEVFITHNVYCNRCGERIAAEIHGQVKKCQNVSMDDLWELPNQK